MRAVSGDVEYAFERRADELAGALEPELEEGVASSAAMAPAASSAMMPRPRFRRARAAVEAHDERVAKAVENSRSRSSAPTC